MHLFYSPNIAQASTLSKEESHHAVRVLRLKEGDQFKALDGVGGEYLCELTSLNKNACEFSILESVQHETEFPHIHIAIAPTKNNDRLEWFLEKCTEMGISEITPIVCEHSERTRIKTERLKKVLISAMKQSKHTYLPKLNELVELKKLQISQDNKFVAHCEEDMPRTLLSKAVKPGEETCILIGPEGDFSKHELDFLKQQSFKYVSLGTSRLRTETAGVRACSIIHTINELA